MEKKREKTGGRKPKNSEGRKITYTPTDEALKVYDNWEDKAAMLDLTIVASKFLAAITPEDQSKVYPIESSVKRKFTDRENELYTLVRKKGLTVAQIIERSDPTAEEVAWMWDLDRNDLRRHQKKPLLPLL